MSGRLVWGGSLLLSTAALDACSDPPDPGGELPSGAAPVEAPVYVMEHDDSDAALEQARLARTRANRRLLSDLAGAGVRDARDEIERRIDEFEPLLREALETGEDELLAASRPRICTLLAETRGGDEAVLTLLRKCLADEDAEVREAAGRGLGYLGERARSAVPDLAQGLSDEDIEVRRACVDALETLAEWAEPAIPQLVEALADTRYGDVLDWIMSPSLTAAKTLEKIGEPAVPHLVAEIESGRFQTRAHAMSVLVSIGTPAIGPVVRRVRENPDPSARRDLVAVLGVMGTPAVPHLIEFVDQEDVWVRKYAALALKVIDSSEARRALEERGLEDIDEL